MKKEYPKINVGGEECYIIPIKDLQAIEEDELVGLDFITEYLETDRLGLWRRPWELPDFGEPKNGKRVYKKSKVMEWLAIPAKKRKRMYMEYKEKQNENNEQN